MQLLAMLCYTTKIVIEYIIVRSEPAADLGVPEEGRVEPPNDKTPQEIDDEERLQQTQIDEVRNSYISLISALLCR
jgi:hypothetical protein